MSIRAAVGLRRMCAGLALASAAGAVIAAPAAGSPPDGRAYELVTPVAKNGSVPQFPAGPDGPGYFNFHAFNGASADGNSVMWFAMLPLPLATNGLPMTYEAHRTPTGWIAKQTSPDPTDETPNALTSQSIVNDVSEDFSSRIISSGQQLDPLIQDFFGRKDLFRQDADLNLEWVTRPDSGPATTGTSPTYYGQDDETATHVIFGTTDEYVPEAVPNTRGRVLYDRTGGHTKIINVLSDDTTLPTTCGAVVGWGVTGTAGRKVRSAISSDGSHIYFTSPDPNGSGAACNPPKQLYLRLDGDTTTQVSASQRGIADPLGTRNAVFQGASSDGGQVVFTSDQALTDDARDGTGGAPLLYRYDVGSGDLSLLTPNDTVVPQVLGVIELSDDASRMYLLARGQLVSGEGTAGQPNLFAYDAGRFTYVGTVSELEANDLLSTDSSRQVRLTDDGSRIAFTAGSELRTFRTGGFKQLYVHDIESDTLSCASCPQNGAPVTGDTFLQRESRIVNQRWVPRNITSDGETVYFDTPTGLVAQDDNGVVDVYHWRDGEVKLISGGHGSGASFFIDASADGRDVFFRTEDRLTPHDLDNDPDIYNARIGGGFPPPPSPPAPCVGSSCQGAPAGTPALPLSRTAVDFGLGNYQPAADDRPVRFSVRSISRRARQRFARSGRLTLILRTNDAGTARGVARMWVGRHLRYAGRARARARDAGTVKLRLKLTRRARRVLHRRGQVRVRITVKFTGAERSRNAELTLVRHKRGRR